MSEKIVHFLRSRDYELVKELGRGACGATVLLRDDVLDRFFVCKKYAPVEGLDRQVLFQNFVREIRLLHDLNHRNIVRVFNYYVYPEKLAGFILMEHVAGVDIGLYLKENPEEVNEVFEQAVDGFVHLETANILHRDIRDSNLMVSESGVLKIIDLGFGKQIQASTDFDKSISLNWWCELPAEFGSGTYDFSTEIYFVGKLFEKIILENNIDNFKYLNLLKRMCQRDPRGRISSFSTAQAEIGSDQFLEIEFSLDEQAAYRQFSDAVAGQLVAVTRNKFNQDLERLKTELETAFRAVMLEENVPDASTVLSVLLLAAYRYRRNGFPVDALRGFVRLLKTSSIEKQKIFLANLHTRLNAIEEYVPPKPKAPAGGFDDMDDDIPF